MSSTEVSAGRHYGVNSASFGHLWSFIHGKRIGEGAGGMSAVYFHRLCIIYNAMEKEGLALSLSQGHPGGDLGVGPPAAES